MRICWRCENKFKVTLESRWSPGCSQGGCSEPQHLCLVAYRTRDNSGSQSLDCLLWLGRPAAQLGHPCTCVRVCASVHLKMGVGYREGATQQCGTRGTSEGHPGYHRKSGHIGPITQTQSRALVSTVGARPRERCASSEGGSGCCRAAAPRTAPFEHPKVPWRGSLVVHYCRWHKDFEAS